MIIQCNSHRFQKPSGEITLPAFRLFLLKVAWYRFPESGEDKFEPQPSSLYMRNFSFTWIL